jgi:hypothetical protein
MVLRVSISIGTSTHNTTARSLLLYSMATTLSGHPARSVLFYMSILALLWSAGAASLPPPPANPFLDPKDDPYNPLRYITSNTLTAIAFGKPKDNSMKSPSTNYPPLAIVMVIALVQTFCTIRYGAKWMLVMVIGEYSEQTHNQAYKNDFLSAGSVCGRIWVSIRFTLQARVSSNFYR